MGACLRLAAGAVGRDTRFPTPVAGTKRVHEDLEQPRSRAPEDVVSPDPPPDDVRMTRDDFASVRERRSPISRSRDLPHPGMSLHPPHAQLRSKRPAGEPGDGNTRRNATRRSDSRACQSLRKRASSWWVGNLSPTQREARSGDAR